MNRVSRRAAGRRLALFFFGGLLATAAIGAGVAYWALLPTMADAEQALEEGQFAAGRRMIQSVLRRSPSSRAYVIAAQIAQGAGDIGEAAEMLRQIEPSADVDVLVMCGRTWGQIGYLAEAEEYLRLAVERAPENIEANERLLELLRMQGRNWDAHPFVRNLFARGQFHFEHLQMVGSLDAVLYKDETDGPFLEHCERIQPESPLPLLGKVRVLVNKRENDIAQQLLEEFVSRRPDLAEAQFRLGALLFEAGADQEWIRWHEQLPPQADEHPGIWSVRGQWAHRSGDPVGAIRCLWEAVRRHPNDRTSHLLLAKLLMAEGKVQQANKFQERGELLLAYEDELVNGDHTPESVLAMIEMLRSMGRRWEAFGWTQVVLSIEADRPQFANLARQLEEKLQPADPLTMPTAFLARDMDLSEYDLPDFSRLAANLSDSSDVSNSEYDAPSIVFRNVAADANLAFHYFVDRQRMQEKVYTFDFAGGGVGVLDYDGDGRPDLYLTQSCRWPMDPGETRTDTLMRNVGGRFEDVAAVAGIDDRRFGHGPAVGDFNGDGFPDVYVTNLGRNTLYRNNGDGTFTDVTELSGTGGETAEYSLSAGFGDLNGDGLADLYVVNYLGGDGLELQCRDAGKLTQCSPLRFPGQPDRLYLNSGDGRFADVSSAVGIQRDKDAGRGMGLLIADFDGRHGLDIYVANDLMSNHLYIRQAGDDFTYTEQGRTAGIAYDGRGRLQGSMGIAAADLTDNGLLDLYVTNYWREANNLFQPIGQDSLLMFNDVIVERDAALPTIPAVGWGTQFLDADLDGDWDLFVANGHLDENTGPPDAKQRPHLWENVGERFRLHANFSENYTDKYFGRAVARLDWNGDGRADLCVTHRDDPLALLSNESAGAAGERFLVVELRGVQSSRDAVGATVQVSVADRQWVVPVCSGDGFGAANQRQILLGVGRNKMVRELAVRWPSGLEQRFQNISTNRRVLCVEGDSALHPIPEFTPAD